MWSDGKRLLRLGVAAVCVLSCCCLGQTDIHVDPPSFVTLHAERFGFKVDIMGTGNPSVIHSFPSKDLLAAIVVVGSNQPKHFMVGPDVSKTIREPDQMVPCGDTSAKLTFYFGYDGNRSRALFINVEPGDGVLLDCKISGQLEAIYLQ